ncbi:hypothetical protein TSACC_2538 [Terrimicrobium sacchariphilum]|uniref:NACHT domain-containing protein n=1 Tax=Terrimicrobium sacchariphilum TaxID=690879 RepID=A0A146G3C0_TERSA|nr:hypothetical protein [Terrimicrobium sacchariphilum]GAT32141.1 hypothetical protein TSACC_2538 [Terrimicrobium sacchariphilum]
MHDYQLERLNTRSFEQLIQALGLEIIGKQLMVFGDGPDGGREASFDGLINYPSGGKCWDGCGIVQAKFRQYPDALAKVNADWAIKQLNSELSKFEPRRESEKQVVRGERICPEYYVFATNLSLSSVAKTGGKDRICSILDNFKKSHGLKDYAVWDRDQICRFLDVYRDIRSTYAAWLLSGDVLAEVADFVRLKKTDFLKTIRRYLEVGLLDDQFAKLSQGGYTDATAIPLSRVFVDLPVKVSNERNYIDSSSDEYDFNDLSDEELDLNEQERVTFLDLFFEEGRQVLKPSANFNNKLGSAGLRQTAGRVVLVGGPGQGKTTISQFACQLYRAALLQEDSAKRSPQVRAALSHIENQAGDIPKPKVLRYPLRIDLKKLAESLAGEGGLSSSSLLDYLVKHISERTDCELSKSEFRKWLSSYPWLIVLDGLDEVPASSNRKRMMDAIRDFVSSEVHDEDADILILATTRPQGYSDEFDPNFYLHLPLASLNANEALKYGSRLASARHPNNNLRVDDLCSALKRATENPATVRLMESPLQVTIMLALIEGGGEPPEQRWKLFHDYYDVIYRREKERNTIFSKILRTYEPDIHWLHHRAGWVLQQRNAAIGSTAARLSHSEFEEIVETRLQKRGHSESEGRATLVRQIREAATDRLVFLVGNSANEIGFEIRSLQEFMAAEHIFSGPESCVLETIREIAPHSYWRNVFLFAAGRIFFEKEHLTDSLIGICGRLNEVIVNQERKFIAPGSRLALAMLEDGVSRNQPENSRALSRCAARILDVLLPDETSRLLELFSSEAKEVWNEELGRRLQVDEGCFPYALWKLCLDLVRGGNKFAENLMLTGFPWKSDSVGVFLSEVVPEISRIPSEFWISFRNYIYVHSPAIWRRMFAGEMLPQSLRFSPIKELFNIYSQDFESDGITLLDNDGAETCNALVYNGDRRLAQWAELGNLPEEVSADVHPVWGDFCLVSEFARNCSSENLIRQFSLMSSDFSCGESVSGEFPWQINACLIARQLGFSVEEICKVIHGGGLGHVADWERWGAAWRGGIRISELGFPKDKFKLVSDQHQGIVFSANAWRHSGGVMRRSLLLL